MIPYGPIDCWRPGPNPSQTLDRWGLGASRIFRQKTIRGSALLQTQTGHLMQSRVGVRIRETVLTGRRFVKVLPPPGSSHRGRQKAYHDDAREITVTTARDF
ncbi:hypothetical protein PanWU01x14_193190 [Parasponia andersonii]|uniref:Uncharacterized protein n=1 Tax=Parasponia andersonii TaxID=3476 RepID=A0A2P5C103_PARAD|nr:hypothetical protein PanWU01x14_193190 [Parasponia andersonii]